MKNEFSDSPAAQASEQSIKTRLLASFGIVLAVVVVMAAVSVRQTQKSALASELVNHTHAVILEADAILSSLHAAEAAQRNFLLTGLAADDRAASRASAELDEHLSLASTLTENDTRQRQRLRNLALLIRERMSLNERLLRTNAQQGLPAVRQALVSSEDSGALDKIRNAVSKMKQEENQVLHERDQALQAEAQTTRQILYAGVVVNVSLLVIMFCLITIDLRVRREAAAALQAANAQLELKVRERTLDLSKANESLEVENLEQRWAKTALERLCRHLELIFNSIQEGIYVVSWQGNIVQVNAAAASLSGRETRDLVGRPFRLALKDTPEGYAPNEWGSDPVFMAIKNGEPMTGQRGWIQLPDKRMVAVCYSLTPVRDSEKVVGAVLTASPA